MPYRIEKHGSIWAIIRSVTGETVAHSTSLEKAEASIRARLAGEHEWKSAGKGKVKGKEAKT